MSIEPDHYAPILPMSLVNGADGIGTGWSTSIPPFNPKVIAQAILRKLNDETDMSLGIPYYKGFLGSILKNPGEESYTVTGRFSVKGDTLIITELPPNKWV